MHARFLNNVLRTSILLDFRFTKNLIFHFSLPVSKGNKKYSFDACESENESERASEKERERERASERERKNESERANERERTSERTNERERARTRVSEREKEREITFYSFY